MQGIDDIAEQWSREHIRVCTCKGVGWVRADVPFNHVLFGRPIPCVCKLEAVASWRQKRLVQLSNIPEEAQRSWRLDTFNPDACTPASSRTTMAALWRLCCGYAERPEGWLVLVGGPGTGKTHLAYGIANAVLERGAGAFVATVPDLLSMIRRGFNSGAADTLVEDLERIPLLVLDDLGAQRDTEWSVETLYQIINTRYACRRPLIVTTNLQLTDAAGIEPRIRSRLCEGIRAHGGFSRVVTFPCGDYRPTKTEV